MHISFQELPGLISDFLQRNKLEKPFHDCLKQFQQEVRKDPTLLTICAYTHETLFGYQEYITRKRFQKNITLNLLEKKPYLHTFISVIIGLDRLQKMVPKEKGSEYYLSRFKNRTLKCRDFPPTLHEINTFIAFLDKDFLCVDIPDRDSNSGKQVDFIFIKNNQKFFVECTHVSRYAGHPIILECANIVISNIDKSFFENLPNHSMIEITFDKKLTTNGDKDNEYSPVRFLEKINNRSKDNDIRINYVTPSDLPQSTTMEEQIEFLRRNHTNQSHIFFKKNNAKDSLHYIRLTSTIPDEREERIQNEIKESFEKKTDGYPLISCVALDSLIDSTLIENKDKLNKMMESSLNSVTPSNRPVMIWIMSDMEVELTQTLGFNGFKKNGCFLSRTNKAFESYNNFFPDLTPF